MALMACLRCTDALHMPATTELYTLSLHDALPIYDRDLRRFLSKAFREEGYGVVEADSGDQALDRALDGGHSCIILDVMLPGRDGFSVVRSEEHTSELQSHSDLVCRLLLEKKKKNTYKHK